MYLFGLAERLHMTFAGLCESISSEEVTEWMAYDQVKLHTAGEHQLARIAYEVGAILPALAGKQPPALDTYLPQRLAYTPAGVTGLAMKAVFHASHAHLVAKG